MIDLLVAALLASSPPMAPAAAVPAVSIAPALDTAQERQALRKLTICVAGLRPRWARAMISYPYLSDPQASAATQVVSGHDNCLGAPEVAVAFRTSGVVGSVAEYFVREEMPRTDLQRLANSLATVAPMNVSEDFALCLAARNPKGAVDLALSDPGGADEARAAAAIGTGVPSCTKPGEQMNVDMQALRALVSIALYRGVTATGAVKNN